MNSLLDPSIRKAIQNPEAMTLHYLPIFVVITFPMSVLLDSGVNSTFSELVDWILVKFIGCIGLMIFYYGLRFWWVSGARKKVSIALLSILSGLGGVIQGAIVSTLIASLHMRDHDPSTWWVRLISGFFIALSWLPINAIAMSALDNYRNHRTELLTKVNKLQELRFHQSGLAASVRETIEKSIATKLSWTRLAARERFDQLTRDGLNSNLPAQLIKEYATQDLRELSHRLWSRVTPPTLVATASIRDETNTFQDFVTLFRLGLRLPPINSLIFALAADTLVIPYALRGASPIQALLLGVFFTLSVYGVARIGEILWSRFRKFADIVLPARIILTSAISLILFTRVRSNLIPEWSTAFHIQAVAAFFLMCTVGLILSLAKSASFSQDEITQALMNSIDQEKAAMILAQMEIAQVSRQWAQHIHSSLQAKLLAMAIILEESVGDNNLAKKQQALDEAHLLLDSNFSGPESLSGRTLEEELLFRCKLWDGIIEIEMNYSVSDKIPGIQVNAVGDAVEEALANAVRHGHASKINIEMHLTEIGDLACAITDNGVGISVDSRPGLGSAIFESITGGNWSRTARHDGPGTRLHLVIPALELPPERGGSSVG